jgi:hypothetical protein
MSWAIGFDEFWERDIGYGVPAYCDRPCCGKEIDRGLAHVCGGEPWGADRGCGLYFCADHLIYSARLPVLCPRCKARKKPYKPTPDHPDWIKHKATNPRWAEWRVSQSITVGANPK